MTVTVRWNGPTHVEETVETPDETLTIGEYTALVVEAHQVPGEAHELLTTEGEPFPPDAPVHLLDGETVVIHVMHDDAVTDNADELERRIDAASAPRVPGQRGRLPQREGADRYAIKWAHEYTGVDSRVAYPIDVTKNITAWGMLGNDTYGDCGPAAVAHDRMLAGAQPTTDEVEKLYLEYTGGQDIGVQLADFLLWLFRQGLIEGFAPVAPETVDAVMSQFGRGVLLGVSLTDADERAFSDGLPWSGTNPDSQLGHAILKVKSASADGDGTVVTWGADQACTADWFHACLDEAWVIVTKDDIGDTAYANLLADLEGLPGATAVTPPAPTPTPEPIPAPTPEPPAPTPAPDETLIDKIEHEVEYLADEVKAEAEKVIDIIHGDTP